MSTSPRRKRLKAAESRQALLDAGRRLLLERGVAPGLDRVTLKDAIAASGIPRSTAYRIFSGEPGPLESFRVALLASLDGRVDIEPSVTAMARVLEDESERVASGDPAQLATVVRELIRVGVRANVDAVAANTEWKMYMSSLAASSTGVGADPEVAEMHKIAAANYGDRFIPMFTELTQRFGLRLREPMTFEEFAAAITVTIEGVALRQHLDPRLTSIKRPTGPNGALQVWSAAAVAFEGQVLVWAEPDPSAAVSADLSTWVTHLG